MQKKKNARREFLAASGALAGTGWLALNAPMLLAAGHEASTRQAAGADWQHLSAGEAALFAAVVDQVIPPDDLPGASEIGVVHFIDHVLGDFMAGEAGLLKAGLADLDRRARDQFPESGGFAALPFDQQTTLLQAIETTPFFNRVIFLTHCGLFALPSWGGNRDRQGWAMIGFDNRHAWQPPFGYYDALAAEEGGHAG